MLAPLEDDLRDLLATWFDVDFLELRRITWDTASGALLEKLIAYEAVHPIENWDDLKNRLDFDRRYFAYFHPRMPNEPLIFVEVALVNGMADNVQALLDPTAPVHDPKQGRHRDLLFDQQRPTRAGRHQLRQLPDQAGRRPALA